MKKDSILSKMYRDVQMNKNCSKECYKRQKKFGDISEKFENELTEEQREKLEDVYAASDDMYDQEMEEYFISRIFNSN